MIPLDTVTSRLYAFLMGEKDDIRLIKHYLDRAERNLRNVQARVDSSLNDISTAKHFLFELEYNNEKNSSHEDN